ncbi:hypothetical protein MHYP_G00004000 [Metynnis hypsauchen]
MKRKGQCQAGIQQFLAKRLSQPDAETEQRERERAAEDCRPEAGQEQGTSSLSSATHWDRTLSDKDKQSEGGDLTPHSAEPPESPISADPTGSDDIFQCGAQNPVQTSKDCSAPVGPDDISQSRAGGPVQPVLKVFPKTQHGNRKRAFNESWYRDYTWLEYSISRDSVFCYACRHFSLPNAPSSVFRTETGFSNWKKALCKEEGFKDHSQSEHHRNAMFAWKQHEMATQT